LGKIAFVSHKRKIDFLKGTLAHAAGSFAKGLLGAESPNAADLHNEYAAMAEPRQRRFWVRFFISHPTTGT